MKHTNLPGHKNPPKPPAKKEKIYWLWWWGINQKRLKIHSPKKKFTDFDKMKEYSAKHSFQHQWIGPGYWSNYEKIES